MTPAQNDVLIELHVPDFERVKEFYTKLGFKIVWESEPDRFNGYLILKMGNSILCFWAGNEHVYEQPYFSKFPKDSKRGYGVEIIIMVDNIEQYYLQIKPFANVVEPLALQPWGLHDFRVEDPNGYYLRFTSFHDILDDSYSIST